MFSLKDIQALHNHLSIHLEEGIGRTEGTLYGLLKMGLEVIHGGAPVLIVYLEVTGNIQPPVHTAYTFEHNLVGAGMIQASTGLHIGAELNVVERIHHIIGPYIVAAVPAQFEMRPRLTAVRCQ